MKIKGNVLIARLDFIEQLFGAQGVEDVILALPPEDQTFLRGMISNVGWYDFEIGKRLDDAIVRVLGKGNKSVFEQIGAASAKRNLTTVHKMALEPRDPQSFMEKTSVLYRLYYDTGTREYTPTGPNSGVMTTHDAETFSTADCLTVMGWYREALTMCGAKSVSITEETCRAKGGEVCKYILSWTK